MIPQDNVTGNNTSTVFGIFSLKEEFRDELLDYLLQVGYAQDLTRARQVWTQAREYYYADTGTVTARPHRIPINDFAYLKLSQQGLAFPLMTSVLDVENHNATIIPNELQIRAGSGSPELENTAIYLQEAGLDGLAVIVSHGEFSFAYVLIDS